MSFTYNAEGVKPWSGGSLLVPTGKYRLRIVDTEEGRTLKGDYKVTVKVRVVGGDHDGKTIPFHTVTFKGRDEEGKPLPGAGRAIHFLKTIGEPWEGEFTVNHLTWRGKEFIGDVIEDEYNGKVNNKIKEVMPVPADDVLEEVPF